MSDIIRPEWAANLHGDSMFYKLVDDICKLHDKKSRDYGSDKDPKGNLKAVRRLGISPFLGVLVRLQDKWARIETLYRNNFNAAVQDESIEDTLMDSAVYSLLAIVCLREERADTGGALFDRSTMQSYG